MVGKPSTAGACGSAWPGAVEESHAGAGRFLQQAPGVLPAGARAAWVPSEFPQENKLVHWFETTQKFNLLGFDGSLLRLNC